MNKKILRILANCRKKLNYCPSGEERELCIKNGVLWEKEPVTHDEMISQIKRTAEKISLPKAAKAFLYSISSHDLRYRTILSSLVWAMSLPRHECEPSDVHRFIGTYDCKICGCEFTPSDDLTFSDEIRYHYDRLVPRIELMDICCAQYVLCDMEYFLTLPDVEPCDDDIDMLNRIFGLAGEITSANKVNALVKLMSSDLSLGLTAGDAYSVIGVLAACGIFDTPEHKSFRSGFVACRDRGFVYERDIYYPLNFWRGKHGINYGALKDIFGDEISERLSPEKAIRGASKETVKRSPKASAAEKFFTDGEYVIDMNDRYRHYYGISSISPDWDKKVMYSVTHGLNKRMEIFFESDVIKKFIYEERVEGGFNSYTECDLDAPTKDRELLLPKTSRGTAKNITPSLLRTPTYMLAHVEVILSPDGKYGVSSYNSSNDQQLPLPHKGLRTKEDFESYTEEYISLCNEDYEKTLSDFINKKRNTVKFTAGDIFRIQCDPGHYTYCLILGKVRQINKWQEVPSEHPLQRVMTQPIIYRQYAAVTKRDDLTAEELSKIPLLPMKIAQDNEILWETYPIVCSKKLDENDIDLGFTVNRSLKTVVWGLTMHDFSDEFDAIFDDKENIGISSGKMYDAVNGKMFMTYGVSIGISYRTDADSEGHIAEGHTAADKMKQRLTEYLDLDRESPHDDFAKRYGGLTRKEYILLAESRFKK